MRHELCHRCSAYDGQHYEDCATVRWRGVARLAIGLLFTLLLCVDGWGCGGQAQAGAEFIGWCCNGTCGLEPSEQRTAESSGQDCYCNGEPVSLYLGDLYEGELCAAL